MAVTIPDLSGVPEEWRSTILSGILTSQGSTQKSTASTTTPQKKSVPNYNVDLTGVPENVKPGIISGIESYLVQNPGAATPTTTTTPQPKADPKPAATPAPKKGNSASSPVDDFESAWYDQKIVQTPDAGSSDDKKSDGEIIKDTSSDTPILATAGNDTSILDMINQLAEAKRSGRLAALDKARQNSLANLDTEEAGLGSSYYDKKNEVAAQSDVGAMNFAQYMAGRGIKGAAGAMPGIYRNAALQGNLGKLTAQEQAARDAIARNRTGINNAYESDVVAANADIDSQGLQAYIDQMNADRAFRLQEGGLTGTYGGNPTLAAQGQQFNQNLAEAGLTGKYNGQPTFDYQRWQTDNEYRNKTFDESVRQFESNYGLNLKQMQYDEAQRKIDNAYKQGQLSLSQAQQALAEAQFTYRKQQDELDRQQATQQGPTSSQILSAIVNDLDSISPSEAYADLLNDPAGYISDLGTTEYQKLLNIYRTKAGL